MSRLATQIKSRGQDRVYRERVTSSEPDTDLIVFTDPGTLEGLIVTNDTATAGFLQIHDSATLPANGVVPMVTIPLPASGVASLDANIPIYGALGLVLAISTTRSTLTISTNNANFFANYKR